MLTVVRQPDHGLHDAAEIHLGPGAALGRPFDIVDLVAGA
jgi:hypothetical protein